MFKMMKGLTALVFIIISVEPIFTYKSSIEDETQCPSSGFSYLPSPYDCSEYYECSNGAKTLKHCPAGQSFNIQLFACDFTENVDCSYTSAQPTSPGILEHLYEGLKCIDQMQRIFLPHPHNFNKFIECNAGKGVVHVCPPETSWNQEKKYCDIKKE